MLSLSWLWFLIFVVFLLYLLFVANFGDITQPPLTVILRDTTESFSDFYSAETLSDLLFAHEYALLSFAVYKKKSLHDILKNNHLKEDLWEEYPIRDSQLIWLLLREINCIAGILFLRKSLRNIQTRPKNWCKDYSKGLVYKISKRKELNAKGERLFALIFRGTDGIDDFWSNFHWFTKFVPFTFDQYDVVRSISGQIVDSIYTHAQQSGEKVKIVTAGHSLGGGLAHLAAYSADSISTVYAFDSSSVTGFYDVKKSARTRRVKGMRIYRIHERGEILAYLRRFMKTIYPVVSRNPQIVEVVYNFQKHKKNMLFSLNMVILHSIEDLGNNLTKEYMKYSSTTQ